MNSALDYSQHVDHPLRTGTGLDERLNVSRYFRFRAPHALSVGGFMVIATFIESREHIRAFTRSNTTAQHAYK